MGARLIEQRGRRDPDVGRDRLVSTALRARPARAAAAEALAGFDAWLDRFPQDRLLCIRQGAGVPRRGIPRHDHGLGLGGQPPVRREDAFRGPDARRTESGDVAAHHHFPVGLAQLAPVIDRDARDHEVPRMLAEERLDEAVPRLFEVVQEDRVVDVAVRVHVTPADRDPHLGRHGPYRSGRGRCEGPARLRRAGPSDREIPLGPQKSMSPPPGMAGAAFSFSGFSATTASVVRNSAAMLAAFCSAERVTLAGSTTPNLNMSPYSPVAAFRPWPGSIERTFSITTPPSRPAL